MGQYCAILLLSKVYWDIIWKINSLNAAPYTSHVLNAINIGIPKQPKTVFLLVLHQNFPVIFPNEFIRRLPAAKLSFERVNYGVGQNSIVKSDIHRLRCMSVQATGRAPVIRAFQDYLI